jgi:hypothetical protein
MSHEHQMNSPEKHSSPETQAELSELGKERSQEIEREKTVEKGHEEDPSKRAEAAREVINKPEVPTETPVIETERPSLGHRISHAVNFEHTMKSLQGRLSPASRSFSKVIHSPVVEKTSETLEKTVMRPSVLNGALWTAVIVQAVLYFTARYYGFSLSGSEIIISLLAGGLLGVVLEGIWRSIKRH